VIPGIEDALARLEARLDLPYPERSLLLAELASDLDDAYRDLRRRGVPRETAAAAVLAEVDLPDDSIDALAAVHTPAARRALLHLPPPARDTIEWLAAVVPLAGLFIALSMEVPMAHYLREGGELIYGVLAMGSLALLLQLHRGFIWFVLRDHSITALRRNTTTPLYLAAATFLFGVLATAVGYYVVLYRWTEENIPFEDVKVGLREPIPCLAIGTALATLIVLLQGALQAGLRTLRVPEKAQKEGDKS
jgi:hypothetical protein